MKNRKKISKISLSLLIAMSCMSCGTNNIPTVSNNVIKISNIDNSGKITFQISENNFKTKATSNSTKPPKLNTEVSYYKVFLLKNASSTYPSGGDPVSDAVTGTFTINKTSSVQTVTLSNIPYSNNNYYYIGVRAYNISDTEIIKLNNLWSGNSAGSNSRITVSSGNGIQVDINNQITDTNPLSVNINLDDGLGARVDSGFTLIGDPTLSSTTVSRYNSGTFDVYAGKTAGSTPATSNQIATNVLLNSPNSVAVDSAGNVYIADTNNNYIEKVDTNGNLKIIAGKIAGSAPTTSNQIATNVLLNSPNSVAVDSSGNVYIADTNNNYIEKIDTNGNLKIIAGKIAGSAPTTSNQIATNVLLNSPKGINTDSSGNVYIADSGNNYIEKVDTNGNLKIIAGKTGGSAPTTSNQIATSVKLTNPSSIALDFSGNVYIADSGNNYIEKIDTNSILKIVAGKTGGTAPSTNNQLATNVLLNNPTGVGADPFGNVFISDTNNNYIEQIDTNGNLRIVAGNPTGINPESGKPGTSIKLNSPKGINTDSSGNVFISDSGNNYVEVLIQ